MMVTKTRAQQCLVQMGKVQVEMKMRQLDQHLLRPQHLLLLRSQPQDQHRLQQRPLDLLMRLPQDQHRLLLQQRLLDLLTRTLPQDQHRLQQRLLDRLQQRLLDLLQQRLLDLLQQRLLDLLMRTRIRTRTSPPMKSRAKPSGPPMGPTTKTVPMAKLLGLLRTTALKAATTGAAKAKKRTLEWRMMMMM